MSVNFRLAIAVTGRLASPQLPIHIFGLMNNYAYHSYRSATIGSTRMARRAGM
jgi:hypothetical protein